MNTVPFQYDLSDFEDESAWAIPAHDQQLKRECWLCNKFNILLTSIKKDITFGAYCYYRYGR